MLILLLSAQSGSAEVYVYGHQLANTDVAGGTISRYTKSSESAVAWATYGSVTSAESYTQFAADILGNIFTMDGTNISRLVPNALGGLAGFSVISTGQGTQPVLADLNHYRNLEVTNSGDFLLSESGTPTLHRYNQGSSTWESVTVKYPDPPVDLKVGATGDYDPFSNRYVLGSHVDSGVLAAAEINLADFANPSSQKFAIYESNPIITPTADDRLGSIINGQFVRHVGSTNDLILWDLSEPLPASTAINSLSLSQLPGTQNSSVLGALAGGVDRNAQELYVFYKDTNEFGKVNLAVGAFTQLPGLPVGLPENLGLSSITVVDTDVKLNGIQGVVSRYNTTIDSLKIGGVKGSGDLRIATNTLTSAGAVTVGGTTGGGPDVGSLSIDADAIFKSNGAFTNNLTGIVTVAGTLDASGQVYSNIGSTTVNSGGSLLSLDFNNSGSVQVDGTSGSFNNLTGGRLTGIGTVGDLVLETGSMIAPGNSVGELTASNVTWKPGAIFEFEISDFTGAAGTTWDLLTMTSLAFIGTNPEVDKYMLSISSVAATNPESGLIANQNYSLLFAQTDIVNGNLTGFDADMFAFTTSGSLDPVADGRVWSVSENGGGLYLNYTISAVPEPTSFGLLSLLGVAWFGKRRRRS